MQPREVRRVEDRQLDYSTKARDTIYTALLQLMQKKPYEKITIKELTERAGVSRMAFYRNYLSKDHVLTAHLDHIFADYLKEVMASGDHQISAIQERFFPYFRQHSEFLQALVKADLDHLIYDKFAEYSKVLAKAVSSKVLKVAAIDYDISKYEVAFASAGLASMLIEWARGGMKESDEDMAAILYRLSGIHE